MCVKPPFLEIIKEQDRTMIQETMEKKMILQLYAETHFPNQGIWKENLSRVWQRFTELRSHKSEFGRLLRLESIGSCIRKAADSQKRAPK